MQRQAQRFELNGVKVIDIKMNPDERGSFAEAARKDWTELFGDQWISQVNLSRSYPGIIRAWHRHANGQIDYFMVLQGALKIVAYDDERDSKTYEKMVEIVASEEKLQIVRIPGHFWHGTKTVGSKPSLTMYFVNRLYNYEKPDEERRSWNDPSILVAKTRKGYDWNAPPHK